MHLSKFCEFIFNWVLLLREILMGTADPFKRLGESSWKLVSSKALLRHPQPALLSACSYPLLPLLLLPVSMKIQIRFS